MLRFTQSFLFFLMNNNTRIVMGSINMKNITRPFLFRYELQQNKKEKKKT